MQDEPAVNTICRVCLRTDKGLGLLFETVEGKPTIADILNECTKYQVERYDELPKQICKKCRLAALNAFKFKRKCEESYCKLVAKLQLSTGSKIKLESIERTEKCTQTEESSLYLSDTRDEKYFAYDTLKSHPEKHENTIICRFCNKSFIRVSYLKTHIAVFHPESTNSCHICKRQFTVQKHLHRHLSRIHKIELNYEDVIPAKKEKDIESNFQDDLSILGGDNNTNSESTQDNYLLGLINHIDSGEGDDTSLTVAENSEKQENCYLESMAEQVFVDECVKTENTSKQKNNSNDHIEKAIQKDNAIDENPNRKLLPNQSDYAFPCTTCNKVFKKSILLTKHINTSHETSNKIDCTHCDKTFVNLSQYQRHTERKHNEKPHKCTICDKSFTTKIYLQRHINTHKKKRYVCKECTQSYIKKEELNAHMKAEGHDKPLLCPECGLRCKTSNILMVHMRRHNGEKPFKCKFCSKGFPRMDDLRVHERYHTGEKSHFCETCGKGFQRKYNLTTHLRVHTGEKPYKCPHCPQAFAQGNDLKAHIRRHTGERFRCEHCDAAFLQGYQIRQHKLSEHGIREDPPTQRVAKFTSTEAQELQIKQNLQKELTQDKNERALDDNNMNVDFDSLPVDVNEVSSLASDVMCSLEVSDFSNIHF